MSEDSISDAQESSLVARAMAARDRAWCPYSSFKVGAAVLDDRGDLHMGCNVENASFPLGTCAEAAAIAAMIAAGGRSIRAIAIAGGRDAIVECTPCGGCRQRIAEFADADTLVVVRDGGIWRRWPIDELLPESFHLD
jgi:cytidine deaminase